MRFFYIFLLLFLSCIPTVFAQQIPKLDYGDFAQLPVLHEGRLKPLASVARIELARWSQNRISADPLAVIANIVFDPSTAINRPLLAVQDRQLREYLHLPVRDLYTLSEIEHALAPIMDQIRTLAQQPPEALTGLQKNLLTVQDNATTLAQALRTFSLLLPLDIPWPEGYPRPKGELTYKNLLPHQAVIRDALRHIIARKGNNPERYTKTEQNLAAFSFALDQMRRGGEGSVLLRLLPSDWHHAGQEWLSPWAMLSTGQGSPQGAAYLNVWADMETAYRNENAVAWKDATARAVQMISQHPDLRAQKFSLWLEKIYQSFAPYTLIMLLYAGAAVTIMVCGYWTGIIPAVASLILLVCGFLLHSLALVARIVILARPPVGTLYESVLFVSWICALPALLMLVFRRKTSSANTMTISAGGSAAAAFLMVIAPSLISGGESLDVLSAVLNTHFWLTTHVLMITAGYGFCILTALVAHSILFWPARHETMMPLLHLMSLIALFLTAIGTILGGIWADQSWGRFWGWDPKENGALLIVLWIIWLQHGRIGKHFSDMGFVAGIAFLNVVVALAWFGVNLLGVGLHSYGFINGIAVALATFCVVQSGIIFVLWRRAIILHERRKLYAP